MKKILRTFIFSIFALWLTGIYITAFQVKNGIQGLLYTGIIFGLLRLVVKPLLKVILFPINLLTFGFISWVINVILLFLLVKITNFVEITAWRFPGLNYENIHIFAYNLNYIETFVVTSLIIGIIVNLLLWISE